MIPLLLCLILPCTPAAGELPLVLPLRERAALRDRWLSDRLETLVPRLMRAAEIDLWILSAREYDEDPVLATMLPATWMAARRRTVLVFHDPGEGRPLERLAVARYDIGEFFRRAWDPETQPDQWKRLAELVAERDPERIALDVSPTFALADGLAHSEHEALLAALPERLRARIVPAEPLAIGWLETRSPAELEVYPQICRIAHGIIAEGLSDRAIQPGVTTNQDLAWWYRERIAELRLEAWFHPDVELQRADAPERGGSFAQRQGEQVILPGDLLHVDFGITYLGLNTDTQQHAYVLRPGETDAPQGLKHGLAAANRLQDILMSQFALGRSGNEVLARTRELAIDSGLRPSIYTHPLGHHGHGAGATIGLWDRQDGVPGTGDWPVAASTCWAIELNATLSVPEWGGKDVRFMLEEDALFDGERCRFLDGRQTELWLVP